MSTEPMGECACPVCEHEWAEDDYYDMGVGTELECPACGAELSVHEIETVHYWTIVTRAEQEKAEAREKEWYEKQREAFRKLIEANKEQKQS